MVEVESSIVLRYACISVAPWSTSSINKLLALDKLALSNLRIPAVGSVSAVLVEKL